MQLKRNRVLSTERIGYVSKGVKSGLKSTKPYRSARAE